MKKHLQILFLGLLTSTITIVKAQAPYASYPLDGNAQDASGIWSGVITGALTATANRFSQTSKAMNFNGNSYIDLPSDFDFPSRTVIVWFNVSQVPGGNGNVIYTSDHNALQNGGSGIHVWDVGGVPNLHFYNEQVLFDTAVSLNTWYQAAMVRTPSIVKMYMNGSLLYSQANPSGLHSANGVNHAVIGADRIHGGRTIGKIDDVVIYNTALSDTAIATNYNSWMDSIVRITGTMFFDANSNQVFDSTEQPVRNQLINIGSGNMAITNSNGDYTAWTPPGTYTIRPVLNGDLAAFTLSPDSIIVDADSLGVTYPDNNFGIIIPGNFCQGSLAVVAVTPPPRPGFNNRVHVRFMNALSAMPVSQTIQFTYPPQQEYVSTTPTPASVDTNTHIITWNLANISSGTLWQGVVTLRTPVLVAMGSIFEMTATISNSTCASMDSLETGEEVIVVGSFDPNDKAVSPVGQDPGGRILPSSTLNYTIRFQNTGTFLAENVNVIDTISTFLNISTLRVEAASHNYEVLINGRVVTFRFSQIMLLDSNANEPMSHGFIKYSIQPAASFVQNSVLENFADIYFDFNSPVRTNTTQNTADNFITGISKEEEDFGFVVYPNPLSSGNWNLITDEEMTGKEVKILDAIGRTVYSSRITNNRSEIDASHFPQGVYLLRIGNSAVRIIKL